MSFKHQCVVTYRIIHLDVWGNPEDGFQVNAGYRGDTIEIETDEGATHNVGPEFDSSLRFTSWTISDEALIKALIDAGEFNASATVENLSVDGELDGTLEFSESETNEPVLALEYESNSKELYMVVVSHEHLSEIAALVEGDILKAEQAFVDEVTRQKASYAPMPVYLRSFDGSELRHYEPMIAGQNPNSPIWPSTLQKLREKIEPEAVWRAYENQDLSSANLGRLQFLLTHGNEPAPERLPDLVSKLGPGFRYTYIGTVNVQTGLIARVTKQASVELPMDPPSDPAYVAAALKTIGERLEQEDDPEVLALMREHACDYGKAKAMLDIIRRHPDLFKK